MKSISPLCSPFRHTRLILLSLLLFTATVTATSLSILSEFGRLHILSPSHMALRSLTSHSSSIPPRANPYRNHRRRLAVMSESLNPVERDGVVAMHWFRKGLRLHDNPALLHALSLLSKSKNDQIFPTYIVDPNCYQLMKCSVLRARFLLECLKDLDDSLRSRGSRLYVASGDPVVMLPQLWEEWGVTHLTHEADETGEPYATVRDTTIRESAERAGINIHEFYSETLRPLGISPGGYVANCGGTVDCVPTSMSTFQQLFGRISRGSVSRPIDAPTGDDFPKIIDDKYEEVYLPLDNPCQIPWPRGYKRNEIGPVWSRKDVQNEHLNSIVSGGESLALESLRKSITARPDWTASFEKPTTSCTEVTKPSTTVLSPYLSLGCLSPRTAWHAIAEANNRASPNTKRSIPPVSLHGQLLWRDFNNLMAHSANGQSPGSWGKMKGNPFCRNVPWSSDAKHLSAWKDGKTGYPWIDACMSQLRTEGWIHHLGRHAVACFLTRGDLWQSWEAGADHFEGQLLDADYALNNFNWLWLSCSGFFYQYFRCYSPVAFQKKNDAHGYYIRKWVPELANLPAKYIYEPWKAPVGVLKDAGIQLGSNYPRPIVDHAVVSKENMGKMALAYDDHKSSQHARSKSTIEKKSKQSGNSSDEPAKKKAKKQSKLK